MLQKLFGVEFNYYFIYYSIFKGKFDSFAIASRYITWPLLLFQRFHYSFHYYFHYFASYPNGPQLFTLIQFKSNGITSRAYNVFSFGQLWVPFSSNISRSKSCSCIFQTHQNKSQGTKQHFLFSSNQDNILYCDNVVLKETYVLRVFTITNVLPLSVNVKLKSDLADQIKFQLENENIRNVTTPFFQEDDYNQLFNDVNLIDEVTIGPLATVTIVTSYRPLAHEVSSILIFFSHFIAK